MNDVIQTVNFALMVIFSCCYAYQLVYLIVGLVKKILRNAERRNCTALPC